MVPWPRDVTEDTGGNGWRKEPSHIKRKNHETHIHNGRAGKMARSQYGQRIARMLLVWKKSFRPTSWCWQIWLFYLCINYNKHCEFQNQHWLAASLGLGSRMLWGPQGWVLLAELGSITGPPTVPDTFGERQAGVLAWQRQHSDGTEHRHSHGIAGAGMGHGWAKMGPGVLGGWSQVSPIENHRAMHQISEEIFNNVKSFPIESL